MSFGGRGGWALKDHCRLALSPSSGDGILWKEGVSLEAFYNIFCIVVRD